MSGGLAGLLSLPSPQGVEVSQNICGVRGHTGDPVVEGAGDDVVLVLQEGVRGGVEKAGVDRSWRHGRRSSQHCVRLGVVEDTASHAH